MKAITIWQPFAGLLAAGVKKYETRSWATSYRGAIAIYAAAVDFKDVLRKFFRSELAPSFYGENGSADLFDIVQATFFRNSDVHEILKSKTLPRGEILAVGELTACIQITPSFAASVSQTEKAVGDWTVGRYAWKIENVRLLPEPLPAKGQQGLWNPSEFFARLRAIYTREMPEL